jgi:Tol biopolymer transport system component
MTFSVEGDAKSGWKPGEPIPFVNSRFNELTPAFSPDGRWLAYASDESGTSLEVYVRPYPGPGGKWQISTGGGVEPVWSLNGRELFYKALNGTNIMAVSYTASADTFRSGTPQLASPSEMTSVGPSYNFSPHPDGQRFAVLKAPDTGTSGTTRIDIVLNWLEELKEKVPAGTK